MCQRTKALKKLLFGELQSLPIPKQPWRELTMDFITGLPASKKRNSNDVYDAILVVVDRFSKEAIYIPARKDWTAIDMAYALDERVFSTR